MDPKGREIAGYRMHAFVCGHTRPEGSARGCCSEKKSLELMKEFKLATKEKESKMSESRNQVAWTFVKMALHASFIHKASGSKSPRKLFLV